MANGYNGNRKIIKLYLASELFQILAAAVAVFGTLLVLGTSKSLGLVVILSVVLVLLALFFRLRGGALETQRDQREIHVVTAERLKTLAAVGVGDDIVAALTPLLGEAPRTAGELVKWLEAKLGTVRAQEKLEVIRRYTLVEAARRNPAAPQPEAKEKDRATGGGPTVFDPPETSPSGMH